MAGTPPPGIDLYANQGGRLVASMIALIVLPTLFVIARLISRRVSHAGYWVRISSTTLTRGSSTDLEKVR